MHRRTVQKDLHDPDNHNGVITDLEPDTLECEVKWASASSPGVRAALWAGSGPSDRSLWPALPGSGSSRTAQAIPASPDEYGQKGEGDIGIKQRLRSAREPEGTKENRQETYSASCFSGKVYLGPSGKPHLPQGQDSPSTGPKGGPGPVTAKPVCLVPSFWPLGE